MAVSLTFQGKDIEEVNAIIQTYVLDTEGGSIGAESSAEPPEQPKKKTRKKKTAKKKANTPDAPDDPMDLFGDDDDEPESSDSDSDDDTFGSMDPTDETGKKKGPTIEDVRDALQNLVEAGKKKGPAMAQKVLSVYGDVSELAELAEDLYAKVIANAEKVVDKLTNG